MTARRLAAICVFAALAAEAADRTAHEFFALDTAVVTRFGRDRVRKEDVALLDRLGYAGLAVTIVNPGDWDYLEEILLPWLKESHLRLFAVYSVARAGGAAPGLDPALKERLPRLPRETVLWIAITSAAYQPSDPAADAEVVTMLRDASDAAAVHGLRVSVYPHWRFLVQSTMDAVRVVEKARRKNLGITMNLCHWLRVEGADSMHSVLRRVAPKLNVVTINGADRDAKDWLQPLDQGDFDVASFLRALANEGYSGPIGLQGFGVALRQKISPAENLDRSIRAWRALTVPLQQGP